MNALTKRFPDYGSRNIRLYYFLTFFLNAWFFMPNWVFYFNQFISIKEIALLSGMAKVLQIFIEIPSGAIADLLGYKKTLMAANLIMVLSSAILITGETFTQFLIGSLVMFLAFAFISGTNDALLYEAVLEVNKTEFYDEILGKVNSIKLTLTVATIAAGGLFYGIDPSLPLAAVALFHIGSLATLLFFDDLKNTNQNVSHTEYFKKLRSGTKSIFTKSFMNFTLPVLFFSMLFMTYSDVVRQSTAAHFGFSGESFSYMFAFVLIPTIVISYYYGRLSSLMANWLPSIASLTYILGFAIAVVTNNLTFGILSFLLVCAAQEITKPFVLSLVNKNTASDHRATALSTISLLSEIPYVVITIGFGFLVEVGNLRYLYGGMIAALVLYLTITIIHERDS